MVFRPSLITRRNASSASNPSPAEVAPSLEKLVKITPDPAIAKLAAIPPPNQSNRFLKFLTTLAKITLACIVLQKTVSFAADHFFPRPTDKDFKVLPSYNYQQLLPLPNNHHDIAMGDVVERNLQYSRRNIAALQARIHELSTNVELSSYEIQLLFKYVNKIHTTPELKLDESDTSLDHLFADLSKASSYCNAVLHLGSALYHSSMKLRQLVDGCAAMTHERDIDPAMFSHAVHDELMDANVKVLNHHQICDELEESLDISYKALLHISQILESVIESPTDEDNNDKLANAMSVLGAYLEHETVHKLIDKIPSSSEDGDGEKEDRSDESQDEFFASMQSSDEVSE